MVFEQLLLLLRYQQFPATHSQDLLKFRRSELGNFSNFQKMSGMMSSLVKKQKIRTWSSYMNIVNQICVRGSFLKP